MHTIRGGFREATAPHSSSGGQPPSPSLVVKERKEREEKKGKGGKREKGK
jgi:hypothetical protein